MARWDRQFSPDEDLPTTPPTVRFAICSTPRSGSHLLGHALHARGAFGYPLEYFNKRNMDVWRERAASNDVLRFIESVRTSPNGVFGVKLHHSHLQRFLQTVDADEFLSYHYVFLTRRDLAAQATSYARASQTGAWVSEMAETGQATYEWQLIHDRMARIAEGNAGWEMFFGEFGIEPLRLSFEEVVVDTDAAVAGVAAHLGIEIPSSMIASFQPQRQSRPDDNWVGRFITESRQRAASGRGGATSATRAPKDVVVGAARRLIG